MKRTFSGQASRANSRMASRNGSPSMSPMVPPISMMTTSRAAPAAISRMRRLDFVGDMRDDLDGLAEIIAAAFLLDDLGIDLAAGEVVEPREDGVGEALVMAEVEVGLGAVVESRRLRRAETGSSCPDRRSGTGSNFASVTFSPRFSSSVPSEAAASPLPSELTTPPVTKIYFTIASLKFLRPIAHLPADPRRSSHAV